VRSAGNTRLGGDDPVVTQAKASRVRGAGDVPWSVVCWLRRRADVARALVLNAVFGDADLPLGLCPWLAGTPEAAADAEASAEELMRQLAGAWADEEPPIPDVLASSSGYADVSQRLIEAAGEQRAAFAGAVPLGTTDDAALAAARAATAALPSIPASSLWNRVLPAAIARRFDAHGIPGRGALSSFDGEPSRLLGGTGAEPLWWDLGREVAGHALSLMGLRVAGGIEEKGEADAKLQCLPSQLPGRLGPWAFAPMFGPEAAAEDTAWSGHQEEAELWARELGRTSGAAWAFAARPVPTPFEVALREEVTSWTQRCPEGTPPVCCDGVCTAHQAKHSVNLDVTIHGRGGGINGTRAMRREFQRFLISADRSIHKQRAAHAGRPASEPTAAVPGEPAPVPAWAFDGLDRGVAPAPLHGEAVAFVPLDSPPVHGVSLAGERDVGRFAAAHCDLARVFELRAPVVASPFSRAPPVHVMLRLQSAALAQALQPLAESTAGLCGQVAPAILSPRTTGLPEASSFRAAWGAALPVAPSEVDAASRLSDLRNSLFGGYAYADGSDCTGAAVRFSDCQAAASLWSLATQMPTIAPVSPTSVLASVHASLAELAARDHEWGLVTWCLTAGLRAMRTPRQGTDAATAAMLLLRGRALRAAGSLLGSTSVVTCSAVEFGVTAPLLRTSAHDAASLARRAPALAVADPADAPLSLRVFGSLASFDEPTVESTAAFREALFDGRVEEVAAALGYRTLVETLGADPEGVSTAVEGAAAALGSAADRLCAQDQLAAASPAQIAAASKLTQDLKGFVGAFASTVDGNSDVLSEAAAVGAGLSPGDGLPEQQLDGSLGRPNGVGDAASLIPNLASTAGGLPDPSDMGWLRKQFDLAMYATSMVQCTNIGWQRRAGDAVAAAVPRASLLARQRLSGCVDKAKGDGWMAADPGAHPAAFMLAALSLSPSAAEASATAFCLAHEPSYTDRFGFNARNTPAKQPVMLVALHDSALGQALLAHTILRGTAAPHQRPVTAATYLDLAMPETSSVSAAGARLAVLLAAVAAADAAFGPDTAAALVARLQLALLLARAASPRHSTVLPSSRILGFHPGRAARAILEQAEAVLDRVRHHTLHPGSGRELAAMRGSGGAASGDLLPPPASDSAAWSAVAAQDPSLQEWQLLSLRSRAHEVRSVVSACPLQAIASARASLLSASARALRLFVVAAGNGAAQEAMAEMIDPSELEVAAMASPGRPGSWSPEQLIGDEGSGGILFRGGRGLRHPESWGAEGSPDDGGLLTVRSARAYGELARALRFASHSSGDDEAARSAYRRAAVGAAHAALSLVHGPQIPSKGPSMCQSPAVAEALSLLLSLLLETDSRGAVGSGDTGGMLVALSAAICAGTDADATPDAEDDGGSILDAALAVGGAASPTWAGQCASLERIIGRVGSLERCHSRSSTVHSPARLAGVAIVAAAAMLSRGAAGGFVDERRSSEPGPGAAASGMYAEYNGSGRTVPQPTEGADLERGIAGPGVLGTYADGEGVVQGECSPSSFTAARAALQPVAMLAGHLLQEDTVATKVTASLLTDMIEPAASGLVPPGPARGTPAELLDELLVAAAESAAAAAASSAAPSTAAASAEAAASGAGAASAAAEAAAPAGAEAVAAAAVGLLAGLSAETVAMSAVTAFALASSTGSLTDITCMPGAEIIDAAVAASVPSPSHGRPRGVFLRGGARSTVKAGPVSLDCVVSAGRAVQGSLFSPLAATPAVVLARAGCHIVMDRSLIRSALTAQYLRSALGDRAELSVTGSMASTFSVAPHELVDAAFEDTGPALKVAPAETRREWTRLRTAVSLHALAAANAHVNDGVTAGVRKAVHAAAGKARELYCKVEWLNQSPSVQVVAVIHDGPPPASDAQRALVAEVGMGLRPLGGEAASGGYMYYSPEDGTVLRWEIGSQEWASPVEAAVMIVRALRSAVAIRDVIDDIVDGTITTRAQIRAAIRVLPSRFVGNTVGLALTWPLCVKALLHPAQAFSMHGQAASLSLGAGPAELLSSMADIATARFLISVGADPERDKLESVDESGDTRATEVGFAWPYADNARLSIVHCRSKGLITVTADVCPLPDDTPPAFLWAAFVVASQLNCQAGSGIFLTLAIKDMPTPRRLAVRADVLLSGAVSDPVAAAVTAARGLASNVGGVLYAAMAAARTGEPVPEACRVEAVGASLWSGPKGFVIMPEELGGAAADVAALESNTLVTTSLGRNVEYRSAALASPADKWTVMQAAVIRLYRTCRAVMAPEARPGATPGEGVAADPRFPPMRFAAATGRAVGLHGWWLDEGSLPAGRLRCERGAVLDSAAATRGVRDSMSLRFMATTASSMLQSAGVCGARIIHADPELVEALWMLGEALQRPVFQGLALAALCVEAFAPQKLTPDEVAALAAECGVGRAAEAVAEERDAAAGTGRSPLLGIGLVTGPVRRARTQAMEAVARRCLGVPVLEWMLRCSDEVYGRAAPPPRHMVGLEADVWCTARRHSTSPGSAPLFGSLAVQVLLVGACSGATHHMAQNEQVDGCAVAVSGIPRVVAALGGLDVMGRARIRQAARCVQRSCGTRRATALPAIGLEPMEPPALKDAVRESLVPLTTHGAEWPHEVMMLQVLGRMLGERHAAGAGQFELPPSADGGGGGGTDDDVPEADEDRETDRLASLSLAGQRRSALQAAADDAVAAARGLFPLPELVLRSDPGDAPPSAASPDALRAVFAAEAGGRQAASTSLAMRLGALSAIISDVTGCDSPTGLPADTASALARRLVLPVLLVGSHTAVAGVRLLVTTFTRRELAGTLASLLAELEHEVLQPAAELFVADARKTAEKMGLSEEEVAEAGQSAAALTRGPAHTHAFLMSARGTATRAGGRAVSDTIQRSWGGTLPPRDLATLLCRRGLEAADVMDRSLLLTAAAAFGEAGTIMGAVAASMPRDDATQDIYRGLELQGSHAGSSYNAQSLFRASERYLLPAFRSRRAELGTPVRGGDSDGAFCVPAADAGADRLRDSGPGSCSTQIGVMAPMAFSSLGFGDRGRGSVGLKLVARAAATAAVLCGRRDQSLGPRLSHCLAEGVPEDSWGQAVDALAAARRLAAAGHAGPFPERDAAMGLGPGRLPVEALSMPSPDNEHCGASTDLSSVVGFALTKLWLSVSTASCVPEQAAFVAARPVLAVLDALVDPAADPNAFLGDLIISECLGVAGALPLSAARAAATLPAALADGRRLSVPVMLARAGHDIASLPAPDDDALAEIVSFALGRLRFAAKAPPSYSSGSCFVSTVGLSVAASGFTGGDSPADRVVLAALISGGAVEDLACCIAESVTADTKDAVACTASLLAALPRLAAAGSLAPERAASALAYARFVLTRIAVVAVCPPPHLEAEAGLGPDETAAFALLLASLYPRDAASVPWARQTAPAAAMVAAPDMSATASLGEAAMALAALGDAVLSKTPSDRAAAVEAAAPDAANVTAVTDVVWERLTACRGAAAGMRALFDLTTSTDGFSSGALAPAMVCLAATTAAGVTMLSAVAGEEGAAGMARRFAQDAVSLLYADPATSGEMEITHVTIVSLVAALRASSETTLWRDAFDAELARLG